MIVRLLILLALAAGIAGGATGPTVDPGPEPFFCSAQIPPEPCP